MVKKIDLPPAWPSPLALHTLFFLLCALPVGCHCKEPQRERVLQLDPIIMYGVLFSFSPLVKIYSCQSCIKGSISNIKRGRNFYVVPSNAAPAS